MQKFEQDTFSEAFFINQWNPLIEKKSIDSAVQFEDLVNLQTLHWKVLGNFSEALHQLNERFGTELTARGEKFHLTLVSPGEFKLLAQLTPQQFAELQQISEEVQRGEGITVTGIGLIDGSVYPGTRPADKEKKTAYVAVDVPAVQQWRAQVGLPPKDLHITLGFVGGDIHQRVVGKDDTGKDILELIPKRADETLSVFVPDSLQVGTLGGQTKAKKQ